MRYLYNENYLILKRMTIDICNNTNVRHYAEQKKPNTTEYRLCDSIYMKF